ncbi:MAG: DMT family transporter [Chloroflexi bacterium]|nr:DMT family transporter [Chloroflexota bacterium]
MAGDGKSRRPYVTLLIGVVAVSFAAIFIRLADAPPMVIATYRLAIASLILIPVAYAKSAFNLRTLSWQSWLMITLSSIFVALHFGLWITSLSYTSIASSVILVTSHPIFVAVISYFLWKERLDRVMMAGIAVSMLGIFGINYGGYTFSPASFRGDLLALMAAFAMGGYLIIGRQLKTHIAVLPYLTLIYSGAAILLLLTTLLAGYSLTGYSLKTYSMMILLAVVPQLIGHSSLNIALRWLPVTLVSVAILGEPVGASLLGYLVMDEIPTGSEIISGLLILTGIFIVVRRNPWQWMTK